MLDNTETIIFANVYGTLTPDLQLMCSDMVFHGVTEAAMESTSTYWVPVWNALCESMSLKLVNPYFIKQLPGRKSDVQCPQRHKNKMKIQVAIARKLLVAVGHMLTKDEDFIDVYLKRLEKETEWQNEIHALESLLVR